MWNNNNDFISFFSNRFINVVDAEKCGLPRVFDTIEISCRTKYNIRTLCNLIYDTVFSLKLPGNLLIVVEGTTRFNGFMLFGSISVVQGTKSGCWNSAFPPLTSRWKTWSVFSLLSRRTMAVILSYLSRNIGKPLPI